MQAMKGPGTVSAAPVMVRTLEGGPDMANRTCSVGGCEKLAGPARGLCAGHYRRFWKTGDVQASVPLAPSRRVQMSDFDRFWAKVDAAGDCWEWSASRNPLGYGVFFRSRNGGKAVMVPAHRFAWESLVGPIPNGHQIDHRCFNPSCVNPSHLEPVTPLVNTLRRRAWRIAA